MSNDVPAQLCPCCQATLGAASWVGIEKGDVPGRPEPGDLSFCVYCATMLKFTDGLTLVEVPEPERQELLAANAGLRVVMDAVITTSKRYQRAASGGHEL